MILLISSWYNEEGYSFDFSHKVDNLIREKIKSEIFVKYKLNSIDDDWYLNLVIATDSKTTQVEVRGPETRKKAKMIDFGLWLPCDAINQSTNPLESYIDSLFDSLIIVFNNYGVPDLDIENLKQVCKKEVLDNTEYLDIED
jgi:hypothetical protein